MFASAKLSLTVTITGEVGGSHGAANVLRVFFVFDCYMVKRVYWVVVRASLDGC